MQRIGFFVLYQIILFILCLAKGTFAKKLNEEFVKYLGIGNKKDL